MEPSQRLRSPSEPQDVVRPFRIDRWMGGENLAGPEHPLNPKSAFPDRNRDLQVSEA